MGEFLIIRGGPRLGVVPELIGANGPRAVSDKITPETTAKPGPDDEAVSAEPIGTPGQTQQQLEKAVRQDLGALG